MEPMTMMAIGSAVASGISSIFGGKAAAAAARNAADIIALGARHNKRDLADAAIKAGKSIEQFRGELLDVIFKCWKNIDVIPRNARYHSNFGVIKMKLWSKICGG